MEDFYTYRLDLTKEQYEQLLKIFDNFKNDETYILLNEMIQKPKKIKYSEKKGKATEKATEVRTKRAKEKIQNAINILRMEDKKITAYSVAKTAHISYSTVKKYSDLFRIY